MSSCLSFSALAKAENAFASSAAFCAASAAFSAAALFFVSSSFNIFSISCCSLGCWFWVRKNSCPDGSCNLHVSRKFVSIIESLYKGLCVIRYSRALKIRFTSTNWVLCIFLQDFFRFQLTPINPESDGFLGNFYCVFDVYGRNWYINYPISYLCPQRPWHSVHFEKL